MNPTAEELEAWLDAIPVEALMEFVNRRAEGDKKADYIAKIMADPESVKSASWSWSVDHAHGITRTPTQYGRKQ